MNIIILTNNDFVEKEIYRISDERFTHIKNILKSESGDIIEIGLLNSSIGKAKILEISEDSVTLEILSYTEQQEIFPKVDIVCALPRPQTLKKVLNTCATMGVRNLYLIRSEKVVKSYFDSPLLNEENYTKFLIEGLSQGKRTDLPIVSIHNKFKVFFENYFEEIRNNSICLLAHPNSDNYLNKQQLNNSKDITLAIGPESG